MPRQGALRWGRALTLASVMLSCGLSGHVAAGGSAPPTSLLGPLLLVLTLMVSPFLDAPASSPRVVVLVLAAQGVLHVVLDLLTRVPSPHHASMAMPTPPTHHQAGDHAGMLAAHVAAALVVALWLAAGERAVWTLVAVAGLAVAEAWRAIRHVGDSLPAVVAPARRPAVLATGPALVRSSAWEGRGGLSRRGPPYTCATA